jgi:hypothetical protein
MIEWGFFSLLLLAKDIDNILQLCELGPLFVDVLSMSFSALRDGFPSQDEFLFLPKPLYFLVNLGQLLLFWCSFILFDFLVPILHLDLVEVGVALNVLYWWEHPRGWLAWITTVGLDGTGASTILAGSRGCGGHCG